MYCSKYSFAVGTLCIVLSLSFSSLAGATGLKLNIDINGQSTATASGAAVIGEAGDVWNGYSVDSAGAPTIDPATSDFLVDVDGVLTGVKFDLGTVAAAVALATEDWMANDLAYVGANAPTLASFALSGLEAGTYDLYLYAPAATPYYASTFTLGDLTATTFLGTTFTGTWRYGTDYVKIPNITVAQGGIIEGTVASASSTYGMFSGLQLAEVEPVETTGTPINIDINGRSSVNQNLITKSGAAAIGLAGDVWNGYSVDASGANPCIVDPAESDFLVDANGNATTVKFELTTVGADAPFATGDDMVNDLAFVQGIDAGSTFPTLATFTLSGLEAGDGYDLYIYATTSLSNYASTFTIGGTSLSTPVDSIFTGVWVEGEDYVKFSDVIAAEDGTITCDFTSGTPVSYAMFNGLQIVPAASVPEPSTFVMLAAMMFSALLAWRRKC